MSMSHKFSSKKAAIESKLPSFEITLEKDPEYQDALVKDREEHSDQHPHSVKTCYVDSYFEESASISVKGYQDWSVVQAVFPKEAK